MKKLFGLLAIGLVFASSVATAQTGLTPLYLQGSGNNWFIPNSSVDTIVKSTTKFWVAPLNSGQWNTGVSFTVAIDSVAGTPTASFQPYISNDGVHWTKTGSLISFGPNASTRWKLTSTVPGVSDTAITVNTNPWIAKYFGLSMVVTSATQRGVYHITAKTYNNY